MMFKRARTSAKDSVRDARARLAAGEPLEALHKIDNLLAETPNEHGAHALRGLCLSRLGRHDEALREFEIELAANPEHEGAKRGRERLQRRMNERAQFFAPNAGPEFDKLHETIRPYTMLSSARVHSLFSLAKDICERDVPGNFVECGVSAGGSSALLAAVIARYSKRPRRLFACDTFTGMPKPSAEDLHRGKPANETNWGEGTCAAPVESLLEVSEKLGVKNLIEPVPGLFSETLPVNRERFGEIALLHMDGDWYSSTRDILQNLFDQVVRGGRIQIDDYGFWEGCKRAIEDFERERGLKFQLNAIDGTGVWMAK